MRYGAWGKMPVKINQASVKKGKKQSERKKDINRLKKAFPHITPSEIERVYNENNENIEDSTLNLSSFSIPPSAAPGQNIELLQEMFEGMDNSYIEEVYGQCEENISQATAFLLESTTEDLSTTEENFGNNSIGFVNKSALKRRLNKSFGEMVADSFPSLEKDIVHEVYESCGHDILETFKVLGSLVGAQYADQPREEVDYRVTPAMKYEQEYPAIPCANGTPKSKVIRGGVWARDQNNYFLDGNNMDAVKKISILKASFPAIDDITVKEIFFQMGDDLISSINKLKELFPRNYREVPTEGPIFIPHPGSLVSPRAPSPELQELGATKPMSDSRYNALIVQMQQSRGLHDTLFQAAGNAAASGNFIEAKKLTTEGKKHQNAFREAYLQSYRETYRRNNERFGPDQVDLHGLQGEEAVMMLENALKIARGQCRKVEVITVFNI